MLPCPCCTLAEQVCVCVGDARDMEPVMAVHAGSWPSAKVRPGASHKQAQVQVDENVVLLCMVVSGAAGPSCNVELVREH